MHAIHTKQISVASTMELFPSDTCSLLQRTWKWKINKLTAECLSYEKYGRKIFLVLSREESRKGSQSHLKMFIILIIVWREKQFRASPVCPPQLPCHIPPLLRGKWNVVMLSRDRKDYHPWTRKYFFSSPQKCVQTGDNALPCMNSI